ncbi:hypothetical protein ACF8MH_19480, partial [Pseudomonas sp. YQ_13]|uniref:hypothetical protein n=1 Tax=Pseudomonas sp. YQ_13 TaxID=3367235 RepID=UPI00370A9DC0
LVPVAGQITEGFAQGILRRYLWVRFSPNLQNLGIRLCSRLPTLHMPFVAKSCSKRAAKSGPQKSQCIKNQIRMITGIGTPIIQSSIERMAFLLVRW